jgi:hypothetical protein
VVFQNGGAAAYDPATDAYSPPQIERPEGTGSLAGDKDASTQPSGAAQN